MNPTKYIEPAFLWLFGAVTLTLVGIYFGGVL